MKTIYLQILILVIRKVIGKQTWEEILMVVRSLEVSDLLEDEKRKKALAEIKAVLKKRKKELKDNWLNLAIEIAVALVKK